MIHRLVYLSSATGWCDGDVLEEILSVSRRNNARDSISGILIFHDGNFLQVLEGQKETVLSCYSRITRDRRHGGCLVLQSSAVPERLFGDWHMSSLPFKKLSESGRRGFIDLQRLFATSQGKELAGDQTTRIFVSTFLESFRDLRLV